MQNLGSSIFDFAPQMVLAVGRLTPEGLTPLGSGFFVGPNKVVTTKHITGGDQTNLMVVVPQIAVMGDFQDTSITQLRFASATISEIDAFRDICILTVKGFGAVPYQIGSAGDVLPGQAVVTFGFPHMDTGRLVLTRHNANIGARVLIDAAGIKSKHLVINILARPGQSGGPVFSADGSKVVAMVTGSYAFGGGGGISLGGIDPSSLHMTTHAISAEYIAAML